MRAGFDVAAIQRDLHVGAIDPDRQNGAFDYSFEDRLQLSPQTLCRQRLKRGVLRERQIGLITGGLLLPFIPTKGATCSLSQHLDGLYTSLGGVPDAQCQAAMMQLELRGIKIDRYQLLSFWLVLRQ